MQLVDGTLAMRQAAGYAMLPSPLSRQDHRWEQRIVSFLSFSFLYLSGFPSDRPAAHRAMPTRYSVGRLVRSPRIGEKRDPGKCGVALRI